MADPTGFMQFERVEVGHRPVKQRVKDWREVNVPFDKQTLLQQAARCMDCGVPFCHGIGCPLANRIPEFNDFAYRGQWQAAHRNLHSTNNFPEITGRVCPAPCEAACTLAINDRPINIKQIEYEISERAFGEGWVRPLPAEWKTGKKVAIVGSGPAGMAAAQQLVRAGHEVVLFERQDRIGGLLRYGIPDFKLEKHIIDRRLEQMVAEGVKFEPGVLVGSDVSGQYLRKQFDAVCLCMGAGQPRTLDVPGAELAGVHLAMDFLGQQNRRVAGDPMLKSEGPAIDARGKHVVVIGGGDTGSDCVGTSIRQGARSVEQLEVLPKPPENDNPNTPWPQWPNVLRTSSSHEEGCGRRWSVSTTELIGDGGRVAELRGCEVDWNSGPDGWRMSERPDSQFTIPADLVLLAVGFLHVVHTGLVDELGIDLDKRGNLALSNWMTSRPGVFAAGDSARGASLVVHAINEGRQAAAAINDWLKTA